MRKRIAKNVAPVDEWSSEEVADALMDTAREHARRGAGPEIEPAGVNPGDGELQERRAAVARNVGAMRHVG